MDNLLFQLTPTEKTPGGPKKKGDKDCGQAPDKGVRTIGAGLHGANDPTMSIAQHIINANSCEAMPATF